MISRETEGAWLQIDEYALKNALMPDPNKLSIHEMRKLLTLFKKVGRVKMPSILGQLKEKHPTRKLIDETWLRIIGYKGDIDSILDKL